MKKLIIRCLVYLSILFFIACLKGNKYKEAPTIRKSINQPFKVYKNVFLFDSLFTDKKKALSRVVNIDGNDFISFIRRKDSSLIVYNLSDKKAYTQHKINFEEEEYLPLVSTCIVNKDSIFTLQFNRICLVHNDSIVKTWVINNDTNAINCIDDMDYSSIYFDRQLNELELQQYCCSENNDDIAFFKQSPVTYFNINTEKFRTPNITYSKMYLENYYGFLNQVRLSNDAIYTYLSYPIDPNIYRINRKTLEQTIIGGKSVYQNENTKPFETKYKSDEFNEKKIQHLTLSQMYLGVIIDAYRNLFYRLYSKDLSEKNEKGLFNTSKDKGMVLQIFNNKFELLQEIPFDSSDNIGFINIAVTKEGLYLKSDEEFILIKQ